MEYNLNIRFSRNLEVIVAYGTLEYHQDTFRKLPKKHVAILITDFSVICNNFICEHKVENSLAVKITNQSASTQSEIDSSDHEFILCPNH